MKDSEQEAASLDHQDLQKLVFTTQLICTIIQSSSRNAVYLHVYSNKITVVVTIIFLGEYNSNIIITIIATTTNSNSNLFLLHIVVVA